LVEKFQKAYAARWWCEGNAEACGKLVAKRVDMLTPEAVADSIAVDKPLRHRARCAKAGAGILLRLLHAKQPALVGGKLPDDGFYGGRRGLPMTLLRAWLAGMPAYLWSGWGAIASLFLLLAAWEGVSLAYGPLILPDPRAPSPPLPADRQWRGLAGTGRDRRAPRHDRAGAGGPAGSVLGLLAGVSMTASMMSRPLVTVLLGTPPIAWLVLAMLWFGAATARRCSPSSSPAFP
jgi:hypothetical protein